MFFDEDGNKKFEGVYAAGVEHGQFVFFWPEKVVKREEGRMENGRRLGVWKQYSKTGVRRRDVEYGPDVESRP